jgi:hypothetical protein
VLHARAGCSRHSGRDARATNLSPPPAAEAKTFKFYVAHPRVWSDCFNTAKSAIIAGSRNWQRAGAPHGVALSEAKPMTEQK